MAEKAAETVQDAGFPPSAPASDDEGDKDVADGEDNADAENNEE